MVIKSFKLAKNLDQTGLWISYLDYEVETGENPTHLIL